MLFINLSNHPIEKWDIKQFDAAVKYGEMRELIFPNIPPEWSVEEVNTLVREFFFKIENLAISFERKTVTVHLMGEPIFCFLLANKLLYKGYNVVVSTTERCVKELNNEKVSHFKFVRFREYRIEN